jgi:hypothetical protein
MKIRLILLSLVGFAAYIMLASFHSKMVKEAEVSMDHGQASAPQQQPSPLLPPSLLPFRRDNAGTTARRKESPRAATRTDDG